MTSTCIIAAGEIKDFQVGDYINKKMARRMDDVIKYTIVAGKKVCCSSYAIAKSKSMNPKRCSSMP